MYDGPNQTSELVTIYPGKSLLSSSNEFMISLTNPSRNNDFTFELYALAQIAIIVHPV